ncbi:MAG: hypothetical protein LBK06_02590, partial [Planctomycetaceae bacterium]|nr:hypothetical protein [Planctomycetaceae bacterium]
ETCRWYINLGLQVLSVQCWADLQFGFTKREDLTKLHCVLLFNFQEMEKSLKIRGKWIVLSKKYRE